MVCSASLPPRDNPSHSLPAPPAQPSVQATTGQAASESEVARRAVSGWEEPFGPYSVME